MSAVDAVMLPEEYIKILKARDEAETAAAPDPQVVKFGEIRQIIGVWKLFPGTDLIVEAERTSMTTINSDPIELTRELKGDVLFLRLPKTAMFERASPLLLVNTSEGYRFFSNGSWVKLKHK